MHILALNSNKPNLVSISLNRFLDSLYFKPIYFRGFSEYNNQDGTEILEPVLEDTEDNRQADAAPSMS